MGETNEFERDLEDQAGLKRPGRIDLRVFQNTPDAGDGHPGLQRCFRNYLHEGGMEKDIELIGFGIKGTFVDINNAELRQLSNIGANTITLAQWGYIGGADQPVKQADSPTFTGLTLSADLVTTSTIDSVDIANHDHSGANQGETVDHVNLNNKGTNAHSVIDTHLGSSLNPHSVSLEQARTQGNQVSGQIDMNQNKIIGLPNCTNDNDVARKKYVDDIIKNYFPLGTVLMYNGTSWVNNSTVPGWFMCDGNNGTPDLEKLFIRCDTVSGNTGGSDDAVVVEHNHSGSVVAGGEHAHYIKSHEGTGSASRIEASAGVGTFVEQSISKSAGEHAHDLTVNNEGVSGVGANKPSFYSLIFIMRVS